MKNQVSKRIVNICVSAMFAAMILVMTAYLFHIPTGSNGGYIHLGDAFIYLAACFLPMPYAMGAAAIGASMADVLTQSVAWAPWTLVIKALMAIAFTSKKDKVLCGRNAVAVVISGLINIAGYYLATFFMTGNWVAAFYDIIGNVVQSAGSAVVFFVLAAVLDGAKVKSRVLNRFA